MLKNYINYFDRLYDLYNKEAFEKCLPDDMEINWDSRLTKTAGTCSQSGKFDRKSETYTDRKSSINLSIKVNMKPSLGKRIFRNI